MNVAKDILNWDYDREREAESGDLIMGIIVMCVGMI